MGRIDTITPPSPRINIDPQRRAWGIMLVSFAVFCTVCLITGIGIIYFLFQSSVPLDGTMEVARGSGGITSQEPIRLSAAISNNDGLSTDPLSQATVTLSDPQNGKQIVTAMTLRGDTSLKLNRGTRPRFRWSSGQYMVELQDFSGELNVFIPKHLNRELNVSILTRAGDLIYLRSGGQYILRASDTRVQVINQSGDLILKPSHVDIGKSIPANNQGMINYAIDPNEVAISPAYTNLVSDTVFGDDLEPQSESEQSGQPFIKDWVCNDNSNPNGKAFSDMSDGRPVLRFLRADNATSHGETGCIRSWPNEGQNVESFNYLSLRATFKINYQSLSACGQDGSECPMMLIVEYRDKNNVNRRWIHGFYYFVDPNRNFPLQCNSCLQAHEQINEKTWFTYDSGNLLNLLANPDQLAEQRPVSIIDVQFKSSGHQYDVTVGDVVLFADLSANP